MEDQLICEPCGGTINLGEDSRKILAVTGTDDGFRVSIHCSHSNPPPHDAVVLGSFECAYEWFRRWLIFNLKNCNHIT